MTTSIEDKSTYLSSRNKLAGKNSTILNRQMPTAETIKPFYIDWIPK